MPQPFKVCKRDVAACFSQGERMDICKGPPCPSHCSASLWGTANGEDAFTLESYLKDKA